MTEEHVNGNGSSENKEIKDLQLLLDPSYPLLQRFREECPGSFKHSQNMVGIIEGVALILGLNVLKLKISAFYHDIGKLFAPKNFIENQTEDNNQEGDNIHNKLSPDISYALITRHVSDSTLLLVNDSHFPRDVIEIVSQHHGTTVLQWFYEKSGEDIKDTFRYKTIRPSCIESMVLMIVDRIEATSRSLSLSGKFNPVEVVDKTIDSLLLDGQFDSVLIKLGDLKRIKESLVKELKGTYSKRIDYSEAKKMSENNSSLSSAIE